MEKKKGNIARLLVWAFLALICLGCGLVGLISYNTNYKGVKEYLETITEVFDDTEVIKNYSTLNVSIESEISGRTIIVTYTGAEIKKYKFNYENDTLTTTINTNDSLNNIIAMVMIDTISVLNGGTKGDTYDMFKDETLKNYTLNDGVSFETLSDTKEKLKINTKSLIKKVIEPTINYFEKNDFTNEDINNNELMKSKGTTTLLRTNANTISISDTNGFNQELNISIVNILDALYGEVVKNAYTTNVNINETTNYSGELLDVIFNAEPTLKELETFEENSKIIRIIVK